MTKNKIVPILMGLMLTCFTGMAQTNIPKAEKGSKAVIETGCDGIVVEFFKMVMEDELPLVDVTSYFVNEHFECACEILKMASDLSNQEERDQVRAWIDGNFKSIETKQWLYKCYEKPKRLIFEPIPFDPPIFFFPPIEDDPPVTDVGRGYKLVIPKFFRK